MGAGAACCASNAVGGVGRSGSAGEWGTGGAGGMAWGGVAILWAWGSGGSTGRGERASIKHVQAAGAEALDGYRGTTGARNSGEMRWRLGDKRVGGNVQPQGAAPGAVARRSPARGWEARQANCGGREPPPRQANRAQNGSAGGRSSGRRLCAREPAWQPGWPRCFNQRSRVRQQSSRQVGRARAACRHHCWRRSSALTS